MKIRSKDEFLDFIQRERSWRRHEITNLNSLIHEARGIYKDTLIRSSVLLLYAHWEGYVKKVSQAFFYYLNFRAFKYRDLKSNFTALGMLEEFNLSFHPKKFDSYAKAFGFISEQSKDRAFKIDVDLRVDTKSNLKIEVLKDILGMIGVESEFFENNAFHIDNRLLKYRNAIAHGERTDNNPDYHVSEIDYMDLYSRISNLMDVFENLVVNHLELESFKV